jgi:hypothetical protein
MNERFNYLIFGKKKEPKIKAIKPVGKDKPPRPKIRGSIFKRQPPLPRR